ncbi:hypothetical protein C8Q79DRAFT_339745 [Trametes meyenii]|nr:hypothetical protein C8Q79DRAFT_339745 [Trametes meyenii]
MSTNINIPLFEFPPSLEPEPPHFPSPHPAHLHQQPQEHYLPSGALLVSSRRASVGAVASARPHPLPARRLSQIATEMFAHPSAMARPPHTSPLTRLHARPNPPALSLFRHVSPSGAPPSFASAPLSQPASLATANEPRTPHELAHAHYPPVYVQDHVHRSSSPTLRQAQDWPSPSVQQPSLDSYNYAPSTPAARADIKHEDPSTDETMLWLHDHSQAEYPLTAEVEYVFEDPIAMAECKQEAYAQDWNEIPAVRSFTLPVPCTSDSSSGVV